MRTFMSLALLSLSFYTHGQMLDNQIVSTAGDYYETANTTLSGTLGEVAINSHKQGDLLLTQGFQQPVFVITALAESNDSYINISLYPNPTMDIVTISSKKKGLKFRVISILGTLITEGELTGESTELSLSKYTDTVFIIEIHSTTTNYIKTYKVIKR